ncbi:MAG: hypothetical protein KF756_00165 [Acidobacteria bacterium]|nr:hypothetical protein [Acidobacteriota bacterium]
MFNRTQLYLLVFALIAVAHFPRVTMGQAADGSASSSAADKRDGQKDFDFEIGTWKTHVKRLVSPLSGKNDWVEYNGTTVVRKVWSGKANLVELVMDGPAGHFEGLSLRLYNPSTRQWSLNFSNIKSGVLSLPTIGEFRNGRGEFYNQETLNGRSIFVRFIVIPESNDVCRFEQSFSDDGGKTWELNWIATDTRIKDAVETTSNTPSTSVKLSAKERDGQHAFDWEFGDWDLHIKRLKGPLTGSTTWVELKGKVSQRRIWNGKANLAEVTAEGATGNLEFLALRLYNPKTNQWALYFASSSDGTLSVPMFGEFKDGLGEFYDQEPYNERAILVRFTFPPSSSDAGRSEQAFSSDGGKTWETNWINSYTRRVENR